MDSVGMTPGTDYGWLPDGFRVETAMVSGTMLSAAVGGSGPTVVLLHGWPQTGRAWRHVMPTLARQYRVVVPDLRGMGASGIPVDGYRKTDQATDLRELLALLGIAGRPVVVGHDIGAMVALAWAAKYPQEVRAVALLDAVMPGFGLEEAMDVARGGMWHFGFFSAPFPIPEMLLDGHELEFLRNAFQGISTPGTFSEDDIQFYARAYTGRARLRGGFEQYRALLQDGRDNRELLRAPLPMPVLMIAGGLGRPEFDPAVPLKGVATDLRGLVAPSGHFIAEEAPGWLAAQLSELAVTP